MRGEGREGGCPCWNTNSLTDCDFLYISARLTERNYTRQLSRHQFLPCTGFYPISTVYCTILYCSALHCYCTYIVYCIWGERSVLCTSTILLILTMLRACQLNTDVLTGFINCILWWSRTRTTPMGWHWHHHHHHHHDRIRGYQLSEPSLTLGGCVVAGL